MKKILIILTLLLFTPSCWPNWYKPFGRIFRQAPKDGTPGYRLGWIHGCQSGLATNFGANFTIFFYSWSKDPDLVVSSPNIEKLRIKYAEELPINWDNPTEVKKNLNDYKKIFWLGHIFCRHSIVGTYQGAKTIHGTSFDPPIAGDPRLNLNKMHSIGNVWSFHGRGNFNLDYW